MDFERTYDGAVSGLTEELKKILLKAESGIKERCSEVRLRADKPVILVCGKEKLSVDEKGRTVKCNFGFICTKEMLKDSFSRICDYSVHTHSNELSKGYITVKGGHRIGITGTAVLDSDSRITATRDVSSLCIRIAREIRDCAKDIYEKAFMLSEGNVILAGPPSGGKTTLLRDLVRIISDKGYSVSVIDERQEIASMYKGICTNDVGINTDVYYGYPKECAVNMAVRTMSPEVIAIDEICDKKEVDAIVNAANCGVRLIVTIHANNLKDVITKYQSVSLLRTGVFNKIVILNREKGDYTQKVYDIEEINDEIYRSRSYMGELSDDGTEFFRAV